MKQFIFCIIFLLFFGDSITFAIFPQPTRIGGRVTINGQLLSCKDSDDYEFTVTDQNRNPYFPATETGGLNASDWYILDIPVYDATDQQGGANPGEMAVIHVFNNSIEYQVISPVDGEFFVGESGSTTRLDVEAEVKETMPLPDDAEIITTTTGKKIGIKLESVGNLISITPVELSSLGDSSSVPENMIYGLIEMKIKVPNFGDTASVKVYLSGYVAPDYTIYKYNDIVGWYDYTDQVTFNEDRNEITISLKDGGEGDDDNVENGIIYDPFGIGSTEFVPATCFINTLFFKD